MGKRHEKIRSTRLVEKTAIRPTPIQAAHLSFSFKYLRTDHSKFAFKDQTPAYFCKLLERLKDVCGLSWQEMRTTHAETLRCHDHDWRRTTEPTGFGLKGQLADCPGWQFSLTSNEHGRVHGFILS